MVTASGVPRLRSARHFSGPAPRSDELEIFSLSTTSSQSYFPPEAKNENTLTTVIL
jgi:hypothetical protein